MPKYVVYQDTAKNWRWRLIADNGRKVAASGEAFDSRTNAVRAAADAKRISAQATLPVPLLLKRAAKPATVPLLRAPAGLLGEMRRARSASILPSPRRTP